MREDQIIQVAKVLEEWNPHGDAVNTFEQLEGYRYEAIDIISTINILPASNGVKNAIEQVLTQAFNIELNQDKLSKAAATIKNILGSD
jgi:hypothetical protein